MPDDNSLKRLLLVAHCTVAVRVDQEQPTAGHVCNGLRCKAESSVGVFWLQVLTLVVRYILQSEDEAMALLGVNLLQELVGQMAPAADEAAWQAIIAECRRACSARALLVLLAGDVR